MRGEQEASFGILWRTNEKLYHLPESQPIHQKLLHSKLRSSIRLGLERLVDVKCRGAVHERQGCAVQQQREELVIHRS